MTRQRRDGQSTAPEGSSAGGDGEKLANSYGHDDAKQSIAFINEQRQIISDASLKIASEMKSIEKRGGNRSAIQYAMRLLNQDATKTRKELKAIDQMREWFIAPMLAEAASGGSEG